MTNDIAEAMKAAIIDHDWTTVRPLAVLTGPIPPGHLAFPAAGIIAPGGEEAEHGRGYADTVEVFSWTLATFLLVGSLEAEYAKMIDWRAEARTLARTAVDGHWGLSGSVRRTNFLRWDTVFYEMPGASGVQHLAEITLKMEVEYREQI